VETTASRGGSVVIPAFAIGRTQELLYVIRELIEQGEMHSVPVHVDSPMAIDVTDIYRRHPEDNNLDTAIIASHGGQPFSPPNVHFDRTVQESKTLNDQNFPTIIISASGMATGGRVLHHLAQRLPDHRNTVMFVGYQGAGTRGRTIQSGAQFVKIYGVMIPIRAQIESIENLSGHADYGEILKWLGRIKTPPRQTFLTHGEPGPAHALCDKITQQLKWNARVPTYLEKVAL
jgi:metallo-beta-lactamase family protein